MKTILLIDGHEIFRSTLKKLLNEYSIIEANGNGIFNLEMVRRNKPDLIIMDIAMPHRSALSIIADLKTSHNDAKILILTTHSSVELARFAIDMGANGYALKDEDGVALKTAISCVLEGGRYICSHLENW